MRKGKAEERETERETEREGREGGTEGEKREERREKRAKRSNTRKERRETREVRRERELHNLPPLFSYLHPHVLHPALAHPGLSSFCSHSSSCSPFSSAPLVSSSSHESFHELLLLLLLPLFHCLSCDLFSPAQHDLCANCWTLDTALRTEFLLLTALQSA